MVSNDFSLYFLMHISIWLVFVGLWHSAAAAVGRVRRVQAAG